MRFSLLRLLQITTAAAVFGAMLLYAPWPILDACFRVIGLGLFAAAVAGAFAFEGRGRIACVTAVLATIVPLGGVAESLGRAIPWWVFGDLPAARIDRLLGATRHWTDPAIAAFLAYFVAPRLSDLARTTAEADPSSSVDD